MTQATYDDANLLMRLYDLRREEKLREARAWFASYFKPKTMADMHQLCPPGSACRYSLCRLPMFRRSWPMSPS